MTEVRVPASTSNLGPGFDCFGLALKLYLTARATAVPDATEPCTVITTGAKENEALPRNAVNLIYRAMAFAARREGLSLPPVDLRVHNDIPLASGLGSSAAAIVAGIKLGGLLAGRDIPDETIQNYATEFEGHPDNDAVHNLQRSALFISAIAQQRYDILWEAMRDRLHQPQRESLVPGLAEALALPRMPGLLGIALSGAGPSILALVNDNDDEIGARVASCFEARGIEATIRALEVDNEGCRVVS